jgi:hypothetical protein
MTEFEIFSGEIFYNQSLYFIRKVRNEYLSICSDKWKKLYVSMYEIVFDRNGAKAYVKNLRVLSQRKIRETRFFKIF